MYATHCVTCHDANGKPTDIGAALESPDLSDAAWQAKTTDEQIIRQINDGTPEKMEPFKEKLTPDEIKALVTVTRGFREEINSHSNRNRFSQTHTDNYNYFI